MDPLDRVPREPPAGCDMSAQNVNKPHVDEAGNADEGGSLPAEEGENFVTNISTDVHKAVGGLEFTQPDQYQNGGGTSLPYSTDPLSTSPIIQQVSSAEAPVDRAQPGAAYEDVPPSMAQQLPRSEDVGVTTTDRTVENLVSTVSFNAEFSSDDETTNAAPALSLSGQSTPEHASPLKQYLPEESVKYRRQVTSGYERDEFGDYSNKNLPLSPVNANESQEASLPRGVEDNTHEDDNSSENTEPLGKDDLPPEDMDDDDDSKASDTEEGLKSGPEEDDGSDKMDTTDEEEDEMTDNEPSIDEKPGTFTDEKLCKEVMIGLKALRDDGLFCDTLITLQTGDEIEQPIQYWAHRCVLAANSSRFQSQFKNAKAGLEEITMTSENARAFEALLDYLYTGELVVMMSTIDELLFLAKQLQLEEVVGFCDKHLQVSIDAANWVDIFQIASTYNLVDTVKTVEQFGVSKFMTVVQDVSILDLPDTMIEPILRRCNPRRNLTAELLCLQLVINWTIHQYEERSDRLADLLGILRKKIIPLEAFETILNADEVMQHQIYTHPATVEFSKDISGMKKKVLESKKAKEEEEKKKKELQEREKHLKKSKKDLRQKLRVQRLEKRELERRAIKVKSEICEPEEMEKENMSSSQEKESENNAEPDTIKEEKKPEGMDTGSGNKTDTTEPPGSSKQNKNEEGESGAAALDENHEKIDAAIKATEEELKGVDNMLTTYGAAVEEDSDIENFDNDFDSDWEPTMLDEDDVKEEGGRSHRKGHRRKSYRPTRVLKGTYNVSPVDSDDDAPDDGGLDEVLKKGKSKRGRGRPRMTVKLKRKPLRGLTKSKSKAKKTASRPRGRPKKVLAPGEAPPMKGRVKVKHKCTMEGCKYSSWRKCDLEDHINSHTGNRPHLCTVCNKGFISRKHLRRHKYIHLEGKLEKCEYCDYSTVRRDKVKEHMRIHHTDIAVELGLMKAEDVGKLPPRKRRQTNPGSLRRKGISTVTIGDDGRITMATQTLSGEESPEHEVEETYEDGFPKGPLQLPAKKRRRRTRAVPSEKGEGLVWKCDRCEKEFDSSAALNHHRRGHGAENPYLCEVCGFSTVHYASMRMHKKIHRGETHKCTFEGCEFETIHKSRLEDHINKHNGIKNHVCSVCGKAFGAKKHMQRHEKLHADVKPISCDYCDYGTTRRDKLRDHLKIHHQDIAIIMGLLHPEDVNKPKSPRARKPRAKKPKKEPASPAETPDRQPAAARPVPVGIAPAMPADEPSAIATVIGPIMTHLPQHPETNEDEMAVDTITVAGTPETREVISRDPHIQPSVITMPMPAHLVGMTTISEEMVHYLTTIGNPQAQHQHHPQHHLLVPTHHPTGHPVPGQQAHPAHTAHTNQQQQQQPPVTSYHEFYAAQTSMADNVYR